MRTINNQTLRNFEIDATVERLAKLVDAENANLAVNDGDDQIKGNQDGLMLLATNLLLAARAAQSENSVAFQLDKQTGKGGIQLVEAQPAKPKLTLKEKVIGFLMLCALGFTFVLMGWIV